MKKSSQKSKKFPKYDIQGFVIVTVRLSLQIDLAIGRVMKKAHKKQMFTKNEIQGFVILEGDSRTLFIY